MRPVIGVVVAIGLIAILAGVFSLIPTSPSPKTQSSDKHTNTQKAVEATEIETLRKDMQAPEKYGLKILAFGVRRPTMLENAPAAQGEITLAIFQSHSKVMQAIKNYSMEYAQWESYCKDIGFNECDENNIFQPESYYVEITPSEYLSLKPLVKPGEPKETVADQVGNTARVAGDWVMFNGTKYWMSFFTIWANPSVSQIPILNQPQQQEMPVQTGKSQFDFDKDAIGAIPSFLEAGKTGGGTRSEWNVKQDPTAPSQPNVLAQTANEAVNFHFPYVILKDQNYKDVTISVQFKAISGSMDQAGGIIFRFVDADNYYVLRANALEDNVILFKYVKGARTGIASAAAPVSSGTWHTLKVVAKGESIQGFLDGKLVINVKDSTYNEGLVGLWTKADSITYFDNFSVEGQ